MGGEHEQLGEGGEGGGNPASREDTQLAERDVPRAAEGCAFLLPEGCGAVRCRGGGGSAISWASHRLSALQLHLRFRSLLRGVAWCARLRHLPGDMLERNRMGESG